MATFLEQTIEWQKKRIAELAPEIAAAKAVADELYIPYRAMRGKIADARANPNTTPDQLAALISEQERLRDAYFTAREKQDSLEKLSNDIKSALESNLSKVNDPAQNPSFGNGGGTTTATGAGQDPVINKQTEIQQNANSIPAGQTGLAGSPNIVPSTLPPDQQAFLEANQADEGTIQSQKTPSREEQALLEANQGPDEIPVEPQRTPSREEQAFLEANQADEGTIQLQRTPSREEQALLEANQVDNPQYYSAPDVDTSQDAGEGAKFNRQQELANQPVTSSNPSAKGSAKGLVGKRLNTRKQATAQDNANYQLLKDWRVRLSLAPSANGYLYKANPPGILAPLAHTDGVVFPYTPIVTANYVANYDPTELVHSNYKVYQYRSSAVDSLSITCDFTAQDTFEANYLLAVIHFFRSITKMFYGQDSYPVNGTPPPLCYLHGYGSFGFDFHPLVITNFTCTFPNDVDYIRATTHNTVPAGVNTSAINVPNSSENPQGARMNGANLAAGGGNRPPNFPLPELSSNNTGGTVEPTYVPTKMQIQVSASPIISRNDISRRFSLKDYATGKLLRGSKEKGAGIW